MGLVLISPVRPELVEGLSFFLLAERKAVLRQAQHERFMVQGAPVERAGRARQCGGGMRAMAGVVVAAALALAGCARLPIGHHAPPRGGETITYTTMRCFGSCPAYTITLGPDGQGIFDGEANTAMIGERRFRASPDQVQAFTAALVSVRPAVGHVSTVQEMGKLCRRFRTDAPSASVRWQGAGGVTAITFYYGCDSEKADRIAAALLSAPKLLPIADLIGRRDPTSPPPAR